MKYVEVEPRGVDIYALRKVISMTTPSAPTSGGSVWFGFVVIGALLILAYLYGTSAVAQMGGPVSPYLPSLVPPAATPVAPVTTTTTTVAPAASTVAVTSPSAAVATAPAATTTTTVPVYLPQPSYRDEGFTQNDEIPIRCVGTVKIRRSSGAFRAEGAEAIANALLVKEKIANQGQQAFESALAKNPAMTTTVISAPVMVLAAPAPHFVGYRVLGPRVVIDSRNCRWFYSGGYWHN